MTELRGLGDELLRHTQQQQKSTTMTSWGTPVEYQIKACEKTIEIANGNIPWMQKDLDAATTDDEREQRQFNLDYWLKKKADAEASIEKKRAYLAMPKTYHYTPQERKELQMLTGSIVAAGHRIKSLERRLQNPNLSQEEQRKHIEHLGDTQHRLAVLTQHKDNLKYAAEQRGNNDA